MRKTVIFEDLPRGLRNFIQSDDRGGRYDVLPIEGGVHQVFDEFGPVSLTDLNSDWLRHAAHVCATLHYTGPNLVRVVAAADQARQLSVGWMLRDPCKLLQG